MTDPQHEETFADTERKLREIITTLRAQLAEARAKERQWIEKMVDAKARADRAEQLVANLEAALSIANATLAAQIEVDAGIARGYDLSVMSSTEADARARIIADQIRNQPHDRAALNRIIAQTREKVLDAASEYVQRVYGSEWKFLSNPNDLIRRDDVIREIDCGGCYGQCANPSSCQKDDVEAINAIPAVPEVQGWSQNAWAAREFQVEAELRAEAAEAKVAMYENMDGMHGAVVATIRELLYEANVPKAAYIDDHVANVIIQRDAYETALKHIAEQTQGVTPEPDNLQAAIGSIHSYAVMVLMETAQQ